MEEHEVMLFANAILASALWRCESMTASMHAWARWCRWEGAERRRGRSSRTQRAVYLKASTGPDRARGLGEVVYGSAGTCARSDQFSFRSKDVGPPSSRFELDFQAAGDAFSHGKLIPIALQELNDDTLILAGTAAFTQGTTMTPQGRRGGVRHFLCFPTLLFPLEMLHTERTPSWVAWPACDRKIIRLSEHER